MSPIQFIARLLAAEFLITGATAQSIPPVWEPTDVITHFCARWFHQSVVKNNTLFIQGGVQTFKVPGTQTNTSNSTLGYNQFLLQVDLKESWDWKTNLSYISLPELPNPVTGSSVRNGTTSGALYHGPFSDPNIYTYGGTTFRGNESFPTARYRDDYPILHSDQYPLWSFNNETQIWNQYDIKQRWTPSYGAAGEAPDQGLAFYLNGRTDNGTSFSTRYSGDVQSLLDGMIIIDMKTHTSRNVSTTGIKDYQPRLAGTMQYVPGLGDNGLMATFGGLVYDGKKQTTSADFGRTLEFNTIDVFDIASYLSDATNSNGTWYSQVTSGDIPPPRIDFCTALASAPDNSTHNIYLYGGRDPRPGNGTIYYDDIYVLSLPSFTWIKIYEGRSPRWGHTCHVVGRQLITVGGKDHHPNKCDWEKQGVAVLDLPTMVWGSVYNAASAIYELSDQLVSAMGGSPKGGAPRKTPEKGWASKEFGHIMGKTRIYSDENGTLSVIQNNTNAGLDPQIRTAIIAGVTVTVVVLIACISWLIFVYRRRNKFNRLSKVSTRNSDGSSMADAATKIGFELSPDEKKVYEMSGSDGRFESPNTELPYEADRANTVTYPGMVELPATNFSERGRWGVPIIRVPSPSRSRKGRSRTRDAPVEADEISEAIAKKDVDDMV